MTGWSSSSRSDSIIAASQRLLDRQQPQRVDGGAAGENGGAKAGRWSAAKGGVPQAFPQCSIESPIPFGLPRTRPVSLPGPCVSSRSGFASNCAYLRRGMLRVGRR